MAPAPRAHTPWPASLWLVRHGESAGNVARDLAEAAGHPIIDLPTRDMDVPLSPLGERQSRALGRWFAAMPADELPTVLLTSPFLRATQTARLIVEGMAPAPYHLCDERLREKEFGSLNKLTKAGIAARFPEEAALREQVGKFYYRPPGGESWCDVILRLRSVLDHIQLQFAGERVLLVAHQVIVMCFRYLLEHMTEREILAVDREKDLANCSVTAYDRVVDPDGREALALQRYNFVAPLEVAGTPVTTRPDVPAATS